MHITGQQYLTRWGPRIRLAIGIVAPIVLAVVVIWHWSAVDSGTDAMGRADREWLLTAAAAVTLTWVAGCVCQIGATTAPLRAGRVFFTQVAGSFVNHVLPAGVGLAALNLRMLRRAGLSGPGAAGAVGLNAAAGFVVHAIALVALLLVVGPRVDHLHSSQFAFLVAGTCLVLLVCALVVWWLLRRGGRSADRLREILADSRTVLRHPQRAAMLWLGSAAIPVLHILTLTAVLHAMHRHTALLTIAVVYLGASALASAIPGPGGFGALDVALLAALTGTGLTASAAATTVVGYRLLTVWLPLIPGAATLLVLLRLRII